MAKILEVSKNYLNRIGLKLVRSAPAARPNTGAGLAAPICVSKLQRQPTEDVSKKMVLVVIFASTDIIGSLSRRI